MSSEAQVLFGGTGRVISYGYDQYGYRTSTTYPDGSTVVSRTNTWDGRIDTLSRGAAGLVDYAYQGQRMALRGYHTTVPVMAEYAYDHLGRLTDIAAGTGVDFHYDYVANENNIWKKRFDHRNGSPYNEYSYDDIDRLARADYLKGLTTEYEAFNMDDLGNRLSTTLRDGSGDSYSVDTLTNKYNSIDLANLDYDTAGNLTTDKDGYQFTYDYENRMKQIRDDTGALVATYDYDALSRRIKVVDEATEDETYYYYSDNWQVLAENDGESFTKQYVFGNYVDEILVMIDGSDDYFYLHDHLFSPTALLDESGSVVERYEYDAYGNMAHLNPNFTTFSGAEAGNPYYFTGRRLTVFDSGNYVKMHYRLREYDTYTGRFFQHDPLEYADGMNLFEYVASQPIIYIDPFGASVHFTIKSPGKWNTRQRDPKTGEYYTGEARLIKPIHSEMPRIEAQKYGDGYQGYISKSRKWHVVFEWDYVQTGASWNSGGLTYVVTSSKERATRIHEMGHIEFWKKWHKKYMDEGYEKLVDVLKPCDCSTLKAQYMTVTKEHEIFERFEAWAFLESMFDHKAMHDNQYREYADFDFKKKKAWIKVSGEEMSEFEEAIEKILSRQQMKYWDSLELQVKTVKDWAEKTCNDMKCQNTP